MTYTDQKINLTMNKLTRAQYESLKSQGLTAENELYYITDDKSTAQIISDYVPLSVTTGNQTSSNPLVDKAYVDDTLTAYASKTDLTSKADVTSLTAYAVLSNYVNLSGTYEDGTTFSYDFVIKK